jgi:hypothetical protein
MDAGNGVYRTFTPLQEYGDDGGEARSRGGKQDERDPVPLLR